MYCVSFHKSSHQFLRRNSDKVLNILLVMINRTQYVLNGIVSLIDTRRLVLLVIKSSQNFLQRNTSKELGILLVIIHRYRHTLHGMASLKDTRRLVFLFIKSSLNLLQRNTRIRYIVNGTEQKRLCIM